MAAPGHGSGKGKAVKTLKRNLCRDCEDTLRKAGLVYRQRHREADASLCDWCHKQRVLRRFEIQYERNKM